MHSCVNVCACVKGERVGEGRKEKNEKGEREIAKMLLQIDNLASKKV